MVNFFINQTGSLGVLFKYFTLNITGSETLTILSILLILIAIGFLFRLPIEIIMLITLPIVLLFMAYYSGFMAIGGIILIGLAIIFAVNYFVK